MMLAVVLATDGKVLFDCFIKRSLTVVCINFIHTLKIFVVVAPMVFFIVVFLFASAIFKFENDGCFFRVVMRPLN